MSRIYLMGFMGAGKSTFGRKLAKTLNYSFLDLDKHIQTKTGCTIPLIFEREGDEGFRLHEAFFLRETIKTENTVIATGGGAPCYHDNIDIINTNGISIYIHLTPKSLSQRLIRSKTPRPLIEGMTEGELLSFIEEKLQQRKIFYEKASITIDGLNISTTKVIELLKQKNLLPG